tara:strand:- start:559 stop:1518 length:960 start_codon:yes stop_codon:yes gene_type:complete
LSNYWHKIFDQFAQQKVLIIGDAMLDAYMWGNIHRQSPEADVPVVDIEKHEKRLGGAANVAKNIASLGATPILCSVIGDNDQGFFELMNKQGLCTKGVLQENRKTTIKIRIISNTKHQLRVDEEDIFPIQSEQVFIKNTIALMEGVSVIIFQDYNKGVITPTVIKEIIAAAKSKHIPIAVDPKKDNFWAYQGVDLFKPNLKELNGACGTEIAGDNIIDIEKETKNLQEKLKAKNILLTLSENGIFHLANESFHQAAFERNIIDVSGAGDSVIAAAALGLSLEITPQELCTISNLAGGLVCEKVGVIPIQKENLLAALTH